MSFTAYDNSFESCSTVLSNNTINNNFSSPSEALLPLLQSHANNNAVYNSAERQTEGASTCQENTRTRILGEMDRWVGGEGPRIVWLHGPAGSGKTAIAHTVAKRCDEKQKLAFSYFFSRRNSDRSELTKFVPTFAYQLVCAMPSLVPSMKRELDSNPAIFTRSLEDQLRTLIVGPFSKISKEKWLPNQLPALIIVVDGLDEYSNAERGVPLTQLITALLCALSDMPFRFFFASRPESYIRALFVDNPSIKAEAKEIPLRDMETRRDVYKYLAKELEEVRRSKRIQQPWPKDGDLWTLADKSEGIFIYASTLVKFVGDEKVYSKGKLKEALASHGGLDSLFVQVLASAKGYENFWAVFDLVMFLKARLSIQDVAMLLQHETDYVRSALGGCQSILLVPEDDSDYIRPYHASLLDFLNDPSRFTNHFHGPAVSHAAIFGICSRRISNDKVLSSPLDDNLFYVYRNWSHHLCLTLSNKNSTNDSRPLLQEPLNHLSQSLLQAPLNWLCRMYSHTEVETWLAELEEVIERAKEESDYVSYITKLREKVQKFMKAFNRNFSERGYIIKEYKSKKEYEEEDRERRKKPKYPDSSGEIEIYGYRRGYEYYGYRYIEYPLTWCEICNQICSQPQDY